MEQGQKCEGVLYNVLLQPTPHQWKCGVVWWKDEVNENQWKSLCFEIW